jgi:hypothetical protein
MALELDPLTPVTRLTGLRNRRFILKAYKRTHREIGVKMRMHEQSRGVVVFGVADFAYWTIESQLCRNRRDGSSKSGDRKLSLFNVLDLLFVVL